MTSRLTDVSAQDTSEAEQATFQKLCEETLINPGPEVVVCDEGHRIKNQEAATSQVLKKLHTNCRIVLTGYVGVYG